MSKKILLSLAAKSAKKMTDNCLKIALTGLDQKDWYKHTRATLKRQYGGSWKLFASFKIADHLKVFYRVLF